MSFRFDLPHTPTFAELDPEPQDIHRGPECPACLTEIDPLTDGEAATLCLDCLRDDSDFDHAYETERETEWTP
ncbi:MAG: hypothetical protein M3355_11855 [Actinomycetota bacterium]|nr:hypothetical protein [Actinomycetota bacterium]